MSNKSIIALNIDEYAVNSLEAIETKHSDRSIFSVILLPFGTPSNSIRELIGAFNQADGVMEKQLKRLVKLSPREENERPTISLDQFDLKTFGYR